MGIYNMNITKGKFKKLLKAGNKKQTNKIKKKVHFRRKKTNNRSLKKGGTRVNLRVKTLKYRGGNKKGQRAAKQKAAKQEGQALIQKRRDADPNSNTKPTTKSNTTAKSN